MLKCEVGYTKYKQLNLTCITICIPIYTWAVIVTSDFHSSFPISLYHWNICSFVIYVQYVYGVNYVSYAILLHTPLSYIVVDIAAYLHTILHVHWCAITSIANNNWGDMPRYTVYMSREVRCTKVMSQGTLSCRTSSPYVCIHMFTHRSSVGNVRSAGYQVTTYAAVGYHCMRIVTAISYKRHTCISVCLFIQQKYTPQLYKQTQKYTCGLYNEIYSSVE